MTTHNRVRFNPLADPTPTPAPPGGTPAPPEPAVGAVVAWRAANTLRFVAVHDDDEWRVTGEEQTHTWPELLARFGPPTSWRTVGVAGSWRRLTGSNTRGGARS